MNKGIKYLAVAMLAGAVAASTYAANIFVTWSAADVTGIALADGITPLPVGSLIEVGVFSGAANTALTGFNVFASSTVPATYGGGFWDPIPSVADEALFATKQLYIVAQSGTQQGIFSSTTWIAPHSTDNPNSIPIDIEALITPGTEGTAGNTLLGSAVIVQGGGPVFHVGSSYLTLAQTVVPEPSSIALVAVGLLGMVGLIRRRS
jgi:hypothetical protein